MDSSAASAPSRRNFMIAAGFVVAGGATAGGRALLVGSASTASAVVDTAGGMAAGAAGVAFGQFAQFVHDYALKEAEDATAWLVSHGLDVVHVHLSHAGSTTYRPITKPHVHPGIRGGTVGIGPVAKSEHVSNLVLLVAPGGQPIQLLPRAASALSEVARWVRTGGKVDHNEVQAVPASELGLYVLPISKAKSANERDGSRWVSWRTRRGLVVIEHIPARHGKNPVERVSLSQFGLTWNFELNRDGTWVR